TDYKITWCPGCPNHRILDATKIAISSLMEQGYKQQDFAMTTGIGCHGKLFDYLNISGFYSLHGRTIPTALGIKLGNPNLHIIAFAGDGDTYSEGIAHFMHSGRLNADITLLVHDNQSFSLTTGQATPTSQTGYKSKAEPLGKVGPPLNPIKLALSSGITFIARTNARDPAHTAEIIEKAIKHKGFSFVEIIQDCIVFNLDINNKDKKTYKLQEPAKTMDEAFKLADEWDYNLNDGKIALGVLWQDQSRKPLEEEWPQLSLLKKKGASWKKLKR
ncbi:MAG: thiamine pyrophosphate-dependent enzyme, partial [Nanoarchaeota archaeon]